MPFAKFDVDDTSHPRLNPQRLFKENEKGESGDTEHRKYSQAVSRTIDNR
ncbi:hypothetical protein GCM10017044_23960 [Kordiimonas sediminis]|uniref:Uncharacterized protein n=1 Tax=Kordiimonas sediminis TaxID=1735581 RepID=A0A919AXL3_9PROT|nr:hypothetical protein GCM10017044_23960 [Kordiimonas sediminis]